MTGRDPFFAVAATTDLRAHARSLRRAWEAGDDGAVRDVVGASWRRLAAEGLDRERLGPRRVLDQDRVGDAWEASPLRPALDTLRGALLTADDVDHVMFITDAAGTVLRFGGAARPTLLAEEMGCGVGMSCAETVLGTNSVGTALAIGRAVQLFGGEHLRREHHPWQCASAPIRDTHTGVVLGTVTVSGPLRFAHPHSLMLVRTAAALAQGELGRHPRPLAAGMRLRLEALGPQAPRLTVGTAPARTVGVRHAEILAVLMAAPNGLSAEELALAVYGDAVSAVTLRVEMSRLRKQLGDVLRARPYRLEADCSADFLDVERRLLAREPFVYPGPLLPGSRAPAVVRHRAELDGAVRRMQGLLWPAGPT